MFGNICISGGTSMLPGLSERLQLEVDRLTPESVKVRVVAPPERKWHGCARQCTQDARQLIVRLALCAV